jgi:hypothetical protein
MVGQLERLATLRCIGERAFLASGADETADRNETLDRMKGAP